MSELNEEVQQMQRFIDDDPDPKFLLRLCSWPILVRCACCRGDFQPQVGFWPAVDDAPHHQNSPARDRVNAHLRRFVCRECAERECPYLLTAIQLTNESFFAHAREKMEKAKNAPPPAPAADPRGTNAAYQPVPSSPVPFRAAVQKLEREKMELQGRIRELE